MENILEAHGLCKSYAIAGQSTEVIDDIDLRMKKGDFTVIMGSSGSGKTTLLNILSSLDKFSAGKVWIDGIPIHNATEKQLCSLRRQKIGFVFQGSHLVPTLTILENILVAGYLHRQKRRMVFDRAIGLLHQLDISSIASKYPSQVSGGELQRASICRALINSPSILFADEPTGNLNSNASEKVLDALTALKNQGQTIVMVTHDVKAARCADRVIFLKDGKVIDTLSLKLISKPLQEESLVAWLTEKGW